MDGHFQVACLWGREGNQQHSQCLGTFRGAEEDKGQEEHINLEYHLPVVAIHLSIA